MERTAASLTCWERTVSFSTTRSRLHRTRPFTATWIGDHAALSVSSLRVLAVAPRRGELLLDGECAREAGCSVSDSGSSSTPPACACRTVQEVPGAPSRCGTSIARANNVGGRCSGSSAVARSSASDATQCRWVHGAAAARGEPYDTVFAGVGAMAVLETRTSLLLRGGDQSNFQGVAGHAAMEITVERREQGTWRRLQSSVLVRSDFRFAVTLLCSCQLQLRAWHCGRGGASAATPDSDGGDESQCGGDATCCAR